MSGSASFYHHRDPHRSARLFWSRCRRNMAARTRCSSSRSSGADPDGDAAAARGATSAGRRIFNAAQWRFSWTPDFTRGGRLHGHLHAHRPRRVCRSIQVPIHIDNVDRAAGPAHRRPSGDSGTDAHVFRGRHRPRCRRRTQLFAAQGLPEGATLDPNTGLVTWTPGPAQAGDYVVRFSASDGTLDHRPNHLHSRAVTPTPPSSDYRPDAELPGHARDGGHCARPRLQHRSDYQCDSDAEWPAGHARRHRQGHYHRRPARQMTCQLATDATAIGLARRRFLKVLDPYNTTPPGVAARPHAGGGAVDGAYHHYGHGGQYQSRYLVLGPCAVGK